MPAGTRTAVLASNSFSGAHLVALLLERGFEVLGISRSPEYPDCMLAYKGRNDAAFKFLQLDLNRDLDTIMAALDDFQPAYVVNFAAQGEVASSFAFPLDYFRTNTLATIAFVEALKTRKYLARYLHISTPEVYGPTAEPRREDNCFNPSSPYAASKGATDIHNVVLFKNERFPVVTIRASNVYGPHQQLYRIIPRTVIAIKSGQRLQLHGGGVALKSYIHIRDVSEGELAALEHGQVGGIYHLAPDGDPIMIRDLVTMICRRMDKELSDVADIVGERPGQDAVYRLDSGKARRELGWRPKIPVAAGLDETIAWMEREWPAIRELDHEYRHRP